MNKEEFDKKVSELKKKENFDFNDLCTIMKVLRSENGCPWDKEQDHLSIRKNLIEETYEVIEAIDDKNNVLMCEELGDFILQAVFHCEIAESEGAFNINDVLNGICKKLIIRHPHIFADVTADTSDEVLKNWDNIKQKTKGNKTASQSIASISKALPSLMRAYKVGEKAAKVKFDVENAKDALSKVKEETSELEEAISSSKNVEEELGDLLFAVVNTSRKLKIDPEEALYRATDKFSNRFALVEQMAAEKGRQLSDFSPEEMDQMWQNAKKF